MTERHPVWFERPVLPDLLDEVNARATILGPGTADDPYADIEAARAAIAGPSRYGSAFMDRARDLRVIARTGIGVDGVDLEEATRRGIAVCNAPDAPTTSTAEHAVALILAAAKNLKRSETELRAGGTGLYARHVAIELAGRTLGVAGFGRIARKVAEAASGLGMRVVAYDPYLDPADFGTVDRAESLHDLLAMSDVVSVHIPLTGDTTHAFGAAEFAVMRDGAVFVNTARGGLVDHGALLDAIDSGKLMAAGLDVTEPEPLPPDHPLLDRPNVVVTPHVASGTHEGRRRLFRAAFEQALQVLDGLRPPHLVNPEVWSRQEQHT